MKIEIPDYKLPSWNQLYSQGHWSKRKKLADEAHNLVWAYAPSKMFDCQVDIEVVAYYKYKRRHDSDNVCAKVVIDGLKDRVIKEDDTRHVRKVTTQAIIGADSDRVVIEVTPVESD